MTDFQSALDDVYFEDWSAILKAMIEAGARAMIAGDAIHLEDAIPLAIRLHAIEGELAALMGDHSVDIAIRSLPSIWWALRVYAMNYAGEAAIDPAADLVPFLTAVRQAAMMTAQPKETLQ